MSNLFFQPGTVVGGQCEIISTLGVGRMGIVYLCKHVDLPDIKLALKVLSLSGLRKTKTEEEYLTRFKRELTATYQISNPHVVRTYGYITDPKWVGYTMEYVDGGDLRKLISSVYQIPIPNAVKLLLQACIGVEAIHNAGIVHRDLKPANILLTKNIDVKITDFGIAKNPNLPRLTADGNLLGTLEYLSPQDLQEGTGKREGDIYALGIIGFEMLTGEVPFEGTDLFDIIKKKTSQEVPMVHEINPLCPPALSEVIAIATRKDVENRYQSISDMKNDLALIFNNYNYETKLEDLKIKEEDDENNTTNNIETAPIEIETKTTVTSPSNETDEEYNDSIFNEKSQKEIKDKLTSEIKKISSPKKKKSSSITPFVAGIIIATGFFVGMSLLGKANYSSLLKNKFLKETPKISNKTEKEDKKNFKDEFLTLKKRASKISLPNTNILKKDLKKNTGSSAPHLTKKGEYTKTPSKTTASISPKTTSTTATTVATTSTSTTTTIKGQTKKETSSLPTEPVKEIKNNTSAYYKNLEKKIPLDMRVKTNLIFRFADYITWPSQSFYSSTSNIKLCALVDPNVERYLIIKSMNKKSKGNRNFAFKKVNPKTDINSLKKCHIFYISSNFPKEAKYFSKSLKKEPILLITDNINEGIINFVIEKKKVKFAINTEKARVSNIRISSLLLDLAVKN